jgi:hypothetical protein
MNLPACWVTLLLQSEVCPKSQPPTCSAAGYIGYIYMLLKSVGTRIRLAYLASIEMNLSACWVTLLFYDEVRPKSQPPTSSAEGYIYVLLVRDVDRADLAWVKIGKTKNPKVRHGRWNCHFPSPRFVTYWKEFPTITMDEVERKYADNGRRCVY